jgi:hypothetical protein
LWKEDNHGKLALPIGEYMALPLHSIYNLEEVVKGISRFIDMWKSSVRIDIIDPL